MQSANTIKACCAVLVRAWSNQLNYWHWRYYETCLEMQETKQAYLIRMGNKSCTIVFCRFLDYYRSSTFILTEHLKHLARPADFQVKALYCKDVVQE